MVDMRTTWAAAAALWNASWSSLDLPPVDSRSCQRQCSTLQPAAADSRNATGGRIAVLLHGESFRGSATQHDRTTCSSKSLAAQRSIVRQHLGLFDALERRGYAVDVFAVTRPCVPRPSRAAAAAASHHRRGHRRAPTDTAETSRARPASSLRREGGAGARAGADAGAGAGSSRGDAAPAANGVVLSNWYGRHLRAPVLLVRDGAARRQHHTNGLDAWRPSEIQAPFRLAPWLLAKRTGEAYAYAYVLLLRFDLGVNHAMFRAGATCDLLNGRLLNSVDLAPRHSGGDMDKATLVPGFALQCWSCLMEDFHQGWDVFTHYPAFARVSGVDGDDACRRELERVGAAGHKTPPAVWSEAAPVLPWPERWSDVEAGGDGGGANLESSRARETVIVV